MARRVMPPSFDGYRIGWLRTDILAGVTLAAVAIPECMGYSSIAGVPVVAGIYTIILPALVFAVIGLVLVLLHALETADHPHAVLSEAWRVLGPGGRMLVMAPNRAGLWARSENFSRPLEI